MTVRFLPKGIDALDADLTSEKLEEILQSSNRPVKTILLDQSKIAGIGNIYASEILWESKISPFKGRALSQRQGLALIKSIKKLLPKRLNTADRRWMTDFINMSAENQEIIGPGAGFTTEKESLVCGVRLRLKRSNRPALNLLVSRMSNGKIVPCLNQF